MATMQSQYAGSAPTQTGLPTAEQIAHTNLSTMLYFLFIALPMGIVLFVWYHARRPFVAVPQYNARILAAVERDRAGITEGDVRYTSIEEMCAAFDINPDDIK